MLGFTYLTFILRINPKIQLEFQKLSHYKVITELNYLDILENQGITFQDIDSTPESSNLKIQLENAKFPLYYSFYKGRTAVLVAVSRSYAPKIMNALQNISDDFDALITEVNDKYQDLPHSESLSNENKESNTDQSFEDFISENFSEIYSNTEKILAQNLSESLLPNFLIPHKIYENSSDDLDKLLNSLKIDSDFYQKIDSLLSLEEHQSLYDLKLNQIRNIMFYLWYHQAIDFRIQFHEWDRFQQTIKAPLFLKNGTKENVNLIQKFNTGKIIKILDFIGNDTSYQNLMQNMGITKTKLNTYLSELFNIDSIRKVPYSPKMEHVSEDLIPLLAMQGFTKKDFRILQQLEEQLNGKKTLDDVAIELTISPARIKSLLDKYKNAIRVLI